MINFIPISILAYTFNGGSTIIDKILLRSSLPNPIVYTFYISILGSLALIFIPFGVELNRIAILTSILSGIFGNLALLTYFQSLKLGEASVVGPIVGALNPLFTLIIGALFLNQIITGFQMTAFFILLLGTAVLTANLWISKFKFNQQLFSMVLSGFCFALAYLTLKEAFNNSNFITGLVISRLAGGVFVLFFLISAAKRAEIFSSKLTSHKFINKTSLLLITGQSMGALFGLLLTFAISLSSPALVNSLFGVQYLVILMAAFFLSKRHPQLLDENLNKGVLTQKILGAGILSLGVYLLSK